MHTWNKLSLDKIWEELSQGEEALFKVRVYPSLNSAMIFIDDLGTPSMQGLTIVFPKASKHDDYGDPFGRVYHFRRHLLGGDFGPWMALPYKNRVKITQVMQFVQSQS